MTMFLSRLFPESTSSLLKKVKRLEKTFLDLDNHQLINKTAEFKQRLENGEPLMQLLPEVFACGREASHRASGMRHYDVQIHGAIELAKGNIIEMKTGEGKTLVATLPAYLNALGGQGVHIVTVNDYLAKRDAEWMGQIYTALGLSTGCITEDIDDNTIRQKAYNADVTYASNSELVFDLLRDKLVTEKDEIVQRTLNFAIIDEIDLILLDEAQTPLIISGDSNDEIGFIKGANQIVRKLKADLDYSVDHKIRAASFTESGIVKVEKFLKINNLTDQQNIPWFHASYQALQAYAVQEKDVDYIIEDGQVFLIDEHTGRVSEDKRYSDGLHQSIEAKERLEIKSEEITLAKTSYQHFFLSYQNLCGMTGTAYSERDEFKKTYGKNVKRIPSHKPLIREDKKAVVYSSMNQKHQAVLQEIKEYQLQKRPVLVGTVSVKESEQLSKLLHQEKVKHKILNAKNHQLEAEVIKDAGKSGNVTISTNMAGRGTDIILDQQAKEAGGLAIIGTGEHESTRIDKQLCGRAGRQGDPGSSIFILSPDDAIYKRFGNEYISELIVQLDHTRNEPIQDRRVLKSLKTLKDKVAIENQSIRLQVLKYDSVLNEKRKSIWAWRESLLEPATTEDWELEVENLIDDLLHNILAYKTEIQPEMDFSWEDELRAILQQLNHPAELVVEVASIDDAFDFLLKLYKKSHSNLDPVNNVESEKYILLHTIDRLWPEFLTNLERIEESIGLRSYGNLDPLLEYKKEADRLFGEFLINVRKDSFALWISVADKSQ